MLPPHLRRLGVELVKEAVFSPLTTAKRTVPESMKKSETPIAPPLKMPKPKTASAVDMIARNVAMVGDDALMMYLRSASKNGATVASVPSMAEKVKEINDPTYQKDAIPGTVRTVLKAVGKF